MGLPAGAVGGTFLLPPLDDALSDEETRLRERRLEADWLRCRAGRGCLGKDGCCCCSYLLRISAESKQMTF